MSTVKYLTRKEVNIERWNSRVAASVNGLIYATTDYLDLIAGNWDALVDGDYECIMPLTSKRKYGTKYLYQPVFCQQLGIIGSCSTSTQKAFIETAQQHYPFAEINLNFGNGIIQSTCNNFVLDLCQPYENIRSIYNNDLKKNLQRSRQFSLQYHASGNAEECLSLYRSTYGDRFPQVKSHHYQSLTKFCKTHQENHLVREVRAVEKLLSTVLCLKDEKRIYFLASTTHPEGRDMEANHFLVDKLIQEFSSQPLLLDFEGSDIPGIASFYKNFGSVHQPYQRISWNHLKWPWSMFKK